MTERQDEGELFSSEDGITVEPSEELGELGVLKQKIQKLKVELEECKKERTEYLDGWQRCKADAINARKDSESKVARSAEILREALVHDIIPALDSFDMEAVRDQLIDALRRHGIERFGKVGDVFNPALHDVAEEKDDVVGEAGSIAIVLRFGYRAGDRVLRPAQVVVKSLEKQGA